jgi:hypothetical protein
MIKVRPSQLHNTWAAISPLTYYWDNRKINCKYRQVGEGVSLFMPGFLLDRNGFFYLHFAGHRGAAVSNTGRKRMCFAPC